MDGGQRVWAPHPEEGYQLGFIVDVSTDTLTVDPLQGGKVQSVAINTTLLPRMDAEYIIHSSPVQNHALNNPTKLDRR